MTTAWCHKNGHVHMVERIKVTVQGGRWSVFNTRKSSLPRAIYSNRRYSASRKKLRCFLNTNNEWSKARFWICIKTGLGQNQPYHYNSDILFLSYHMLLWSYFWPNPYQKSNRPNLPNADIIQFEWPNGSNPIKCVPIWIAK